MSKVKTYHWETPETPAQITLLDLHNGMKGLTRYVKGEFEEVNQRLDGIDNRLDRIENDVSEIKDTLRKVAEKVL